MHFIARKRRAVLLARCDLTSRAGGLGWCRSGQFTAARFLLAALFLVPVRIVFPAIGLSGWTAEHALFLRSGIAAFFNLDLGQVLLRSTTAGSTVVHLDVVDLSTLPQAIGVQRDVTRGVVGLDPSLGDYEASAGYPRVQQHGKQAVDDPVQVTTSGSRTGTADTSGDDDADNMLLIAVAVLAFLCLIVLEAVCYVGYTWRRDVRASASASHTQAQ
eukprot:m.49354 g.49354  ORF g.49354 m.49354 type:complete len:216 (-) comp6473_c0_seq2:68-715(-)